MHIITEEEFQQDAEPIVHKIFIRNDYTEPFQPQVEEKLLLYFPIGGEPERHHYLERNLSEALAYASQFIGDTSCYLVSEWTQETHYYKNKLVNQYASVACSELPDALAAKPGSSNTIWCKLNMRNANYCLCSESGRWGLLTTIEDHAFLGGTLEFMQAVKNYFPYIEQEVYEYLGNLRLEQMDGEKIDIQWLKQLLSHVYDSITAQNLLREAELV
jgi:hypothetical protein